MARISRFTNFPLEIPEETSFSTPGNSAKLCDSPWECDTPQKQKK